MQVMRGLGMPPDNDNVVRLSEFIEKLRVFAEEMPMGMREHMVPSIGPVYLLS